MTASEDGGNQHRRSRNPDELQAELESVDFDGDAEVLEELREEARETVESQKETLRDIDDKASKVLRLNVLLLAVLVSAFSIAAQWGVDMDGGTVELHTFTNTYILLGLSSIVASTALAAATYMTSELDVGVSSHNLQALLETDFSKADVDELLVKNYIVRINFNRSTNTRNIPLYSATVLFLIYGVILLSLGVYRAVIAEVPVGLLLASAGLILAITWKSHVIRQSKRAVYDYLEWR